MDNSECSSLSEFSEIIAKEEKKEVQIINKDFDLIKHHPAPPVTPPTDTDVTPIIEVPDVNPPLNVPFLPTEIKNIDKIPQIDRPVFTIINEEDVPLGNADHAPWFYGSGLLAIAIGILLKRRS